MRVITWESFTTSETLFQKYSRLLLLESLCVYISPVLLFNLGASFADARTPMSKQESINCIATLRKPKKPELFLSDCVVNKATDVRVSLISTPPKRSSMLQEFSRNTKNSHFAKYFQSPRFVSEGDVLAVPDCGSTIRSGQHENPYYQFYLVQSLSSGVNSASVLPKSAWIDKASTRLIQQGRSASLIPSTYHPFVTPPSSLSHEEGLPSITLRIIVAFCVVEC